MTRNELTHFWSTHQPHRTACLVGIRLPLQYASARPSTHRDGLALEAIRNCTGTHQDLVLLCDDVWVREEVSQYWFLGVPMNREHLQVHPLCQLGRVTRSLVFSATVMTHSRRQEMPNRSLPDTNNSCRDGSSCHELGNCAQLPTLFMSSERKTCAGGDLRPRTLREMQTRVPV